MLISRREFRLLLVVGALIASSSLADAQGNPGSITLRLLPGNAGSGATPNAVVIDNTTADGIDAWSYGLCHDPTEATIASVVDGPDLLASNNGDGPDFSDTNIAADGLSQFVIIDFFGNPTLSPGTNEVLHVEYAAAGTVAVTSVAFCDTQGSPPAEIQIVIDQSGWIPATVGSNVPLDGSFPTFRYRIPATIGSFDPATGSGTVSVEPTIVEESDLSVPTYGFSLGLAHDSTVLIATFVEPVGPLPGLRAGSGPEFFGVTIYPNGVTVGVVYELSNLVTLEFEVESPVISIDYVTVPSAVQGVTGVLSTTLPFVSTLGNPPVENRVVISSGGATVLPVLEPGIVTLNALGTFRRGECNADGSYDIGDSVALLGLLFNSGTVTCESACDGNDDGALNIADAVYALANLFIGGPNPPAPYPNCNDEPTPDALTCDSYPPC